jgi:hypothetical protein
LGCESGPMPSLKKSSHRFEPFRGLSSVNSPINHSCCCSQTFEPIMNAQKYAQEAWCVADAKVRTVATEAFLSA